MAKSAEVKLAIFGRAGVGKSGKLCYGCLSVCVCARATASWDWAEGWLTFLIFSCVVLLDEVSFSLSRIFILHNQVLCILIYDKVSLLIYTRQWIYHRSLYSKERY